MKFLLKILKWLGGLIVVAVIALVAWLVFFPPDLIRVGSGYAAKIVCSNVFLAGRNAQDVLKLDVQAPGHPLLRLMSVDVDQQTGMVSAGLFGFLGKSVAIYREGLGCTSFPKGPADVDRVVTGPLVEAAQGEGMWPDGASVPPQEPEIAAILNDSQMAGPGMRAIVVVRDGQIVGEKYGAGFSEKTRLLGWSMAKTVNAALIGTAVKAGRIIGIENDGLFPAWRSDGRAEINVDSLMGMSSGLEFNEDYGDVTDVTRMLFLETDMARFAETKPLTGEVGKMFNYSSGTAVMLSRLWQDAVGTDRAVDWPKDSLFSPIGMDSAVMEMDAAGTYIGSSYLYATARDWARFGQFLLQDGKWKGADILPEGFVLWMRQEVPASAGRYGHGQLWLKGPGGENGENPDQGFDLPADTYWLLGHDGQSTAIIPSKGLVIVRLGLTPSKLGYKPQALVWAVVKAFD